MNLKYTFALAALAFSLLQAGEVVTVRKPSRSEKIAVADLKACFKAVTGKEIKDSPYTFYIGKEASKAKWFKVPAYEPEKWTIASKGNEIVITGDIPGTVWGIYEFLEKYMGCEFLAPDTSVIPQNRNWKMADGIMDSRKPAIANREMSNGVPFFNTNSFRLKRKENHRTYSETTVQYGKPGRCHTFAAYVKDWPKGTPPRAKGNPLSICLSSPKAAELAAQKMMGYIRENRKKNPKELWARLYDLSQNDGGTGNCLCADCKKIMESEGGNYSAVNLTFINRVAEIVEKEFPDVYITTFAYQYTQTPPAKIKARKNVIIISCNSTADRPLLPDNPNGEILRKWSEHGEHFGIWSYWKSYSGEETPYMKPRSVMQAELKFCRDCKVYRYYAENENAMNRSFYALQYYLWSHLVVNPDADMAALTEKFMKGYYGAAAKPMTQYLEYLEKRELARPWGPRGGNMMFFLDEDFFRTSNRYLDEAEKLAKDDPKAFAHVRHERISVDSALLNRQDVFAKTDLLKNKKEIIQRWRSSLEELANRKHITWHKKNPKKNVLANVKTFAGLYESMPFAVPDFAKGKRYTDFHWSNFRNGSPDMTRIVDDPDASSGKTHAVNAKTQPAEKWKKHKKPMHLLPFGYGLYDSTAPKDRKQVASFELNASQIPQDEKYHWYNLGKHVITKDLRVHFHWTWGISCYFRRAITGIRQDVPKEIWVSMKFTGSTYVKGSKQSDGVYVDRVIVLEND